jgi:hypothetical protein
MYYVTNVLYEFYILNILLLLPLALQPLVCFGLIDNCPPGFSIDLIRKVQPTEAVVFVS